MIALAAARRTSISQSRAFISATGYGSAENLAWLVHERGIEPHIPVFDHSNRRTDTFTRSEFRFDHERDAYICPGGNELRQYRRAFETPRSGVDKEGLMRYRASGLPAPADVDGAIDRLGVAEIAWGRRLPGEGEFAPALPPAEAAPRLDAAAGSDHAAIASNLSTLTDQEGGAIASTSSTLPHGKRRRSGVGARKGEGGAGPP